MNEAPKLLTAVQVRERLGNISDMTLWRWLSDTSLRFPRPIVIQRRRFFKESEIDHWVAQRAMQPEAAA